MKKAQLAAPVYMLSIYQLDTLLAGRVGGVHSVLVISFRQIDSFDRIDPPLSHSLKFWFYHIDNNQSFNLLEMIGAQYLAVQ